MQTETSPTTPIYSASAGVEAIKLANEARRMLVRASSLFADAGDLTKALEAMACSFQVSAIKGIR